MQRFKDILCVIGTEPHGDGALARAHTLAVNNQAGLSVVQVIDEIPPNTKLMDRVMSPVDLQEKLFGTILSNHFLKQPETFQYCR